MVEAFVLIQTEVGRAEVVAKQLAGLSGVLSSEYVTSGSVRALEGDDVSDREAFSARGDVVSPASAGSSSTRLRRLLANWGHWYRASGSSVSSCSSFEDSEAIAVRGEEWAAWPEDAAG